jgi:ABC-type sugar transport system permease subunit
MAQSTAVPREQNAQPYKGPSLWTRMRRNAWGYVFVSPWVLVYLVFGLYPLVLSFYLTFFTYSFIRPEDYVFVGIGNWIQGLLDPLFWKGVVNIFYNQVIFIFLTNVIGLGTALLLYKAIFGGRIFRTVYFMPVITSVVVLMAIGGYLVSPTGPIQTSMVRFGLLSSPIFWKFSTYLPMPIIAMINAWKWFGVSTVIYLAGLYAVDVTLYEAAAIDGASGWDQFWSITLPLLRPQIFFLLVVNVINGLQMFTEIYTLGYDVFGGPQHQALTPVLYLYGQAFARSNIGYASALGLLLAVLIAILTILQFRIFPSEVE